MKLRKGDGLLLTIPVLACLGLVWVLAQVYLTTVTQQPQPSSPSVMQQDQLASPSSLQALNAVDLLPPGSTLLELREADLNNDGDSEFVLVFTGEGDAYGSGMTGIAVVARHEDSYRKTWDMQLSSEGQVADVATRDINLDGVQELLVLQSSEDGAKHFLHIFAWDGAKYTSLGADGEEAFESAYYPPEVRNVDSTDLDEVVVFEDDLSSQRLKAAIYYWNGKAYARVSWIIILGPPRPSSERAQ